MLNVEERAESSELLVQSLGGFSYEVAPVGVIYAISAVSYGLRLALSGSFTAYFLSGWLPDGTGLELRRKIRMFDPRTLVIFYSALTRECDLEDAMSAGAQANLIKSDDLA